MSLSDLMNTALPMNRKERYFTGTVFPMIVCGNGFRDFDILASLIPNCVLPPIDAHPRSTNLQFFTEYSLVESIYGAETKARFPQPPTSKDTPDIMILVQGSFSVLIALEAKLYDQPSGLELIKQMGAQRLQLDYLQEHLNLDVVHHAALLPHGLTSKIKAQLPTEGPNDFPVILWEDLLHAYRPVRSDADYFMGMLELALDLWPTLSAKKSEVHAELLLTGDKILERLNDPAVRVVGRRGGLLGPAFTEDVATGGWRHHVYEISSQEEQLSGNPNWFSVEAFAARVEGQQ